MEPVMRVYNFLATEYDPRTIHWPLVRSPVPLILMSLGYLYFVLNLGPRLMKDRPAYSLKAFTRWYNLFQIFVNAWIVYSFIDGGWFTKLSAFRCERVVQSYDYGHYKIATTVWWALMLKVIDFIETVVYVLRKKYSQISFLHVYHHVSTAGLAWLCIRYTAGGMGSFIILINCGVHVVMYTYYFLSTLGPAVRNAISFVKPLITTIQLVQFVGLLLYSSQAYFKDCCIVQRTAGVIVVFNLLMNLFLFVKFYRETYVKPKKTKLA